MMYDSRINVALFLLLLFRSQWRSIMLQSMKMDFVVESNCVVGMM